MAPSYAPPGAALVSASVLDAAADAGAPWSAAVRDAAHVWFGPEVGGWRHLRTYHIPHAQPEQRPAGPRARGERPVRLDDGMYVCGDHRDTASLHGALLSGRRAAEAVLETAGLTEDAAGNPGGRATRKKM